MGLHTHGGEHHEISDGGWLMMTKAEDPLLFEAPKGLQIWPTNEE